MALSPFCSKLIADVGISLGDEGKGRLIPEIVAELREQESRPDPVAIVLKVNGGANSGHTAGGLKLNLLPAGVVEMEVPCLAIASGVVADPRKLWWEATPLEAKGYEILRRLSIDERTMVSDVSHRLLDLSWEHYRVNVLREEARGSTGRGISPAYMDESGQWQIFYGEFLGRKEDFARRMERRIERTLLTIRHVCKVDEESWNDFFDVLTRAEERANSEAIDAGIFSADEFDFTRFRGEKPFTLDVDGIIDTYWECGSSLARHIVDVREMILEALRDGKYILGEFGQSFWLDKRHGFSPNVTASHTFTSEFFASGGIPVQAIHTIGAAKAYDTKVGTHTFITKIDDGHPLGVMLRELEFGTSTGRQRMVGWFDAVEKGDALRYGGFQCLALNKLDALTHQGAWKGDLQVCIAYEDAEGKRYRHVPRTTSVHRKLKPVYRTYPGWGEDLSEVRGFADLPRNAQRYAAGVFRDMVEIAFEGEEGARGLPNFRYIGVGPSPAQLIKDVPSPAELLELANGGD